MNKIFIDDIFLIANYNSNKGQRLVEINEFSTCP